LRATRTSLLMAALIAVALVGCSSSSKTSTPSTASGASSTTVSLPPLTTTTLGDPNDTPNPIPFDVGEIPARPNGWRVGVTKVVRPLTASGLPALPAGQEYVGVDIIMMYDGSGGPETVDARKLFGLRDQTGRGHAAITGAMGTTGLDGKYTAGSNHTGRMIFAVPVGKQLLMSLDGPVIGTQVTVFQIDPPNHPLVD
jgi:hypothetical protein